MAPVPPPPGVKTPWAGGSAGYAAPPSAGTNGLAVASLVLGIIGFFLPVGVLALIFGILGKRQARERKQGGDGMATAGIVLGSITTALVLLFLFAALLFEL